MFTANRVKHNLHSSASDYFLLFFVSVNLYVLSCYSFCAWCADVELLVISIQNVSEAGQSHLRVRLQCQSMDLAAELVQDLARYFKLEELESEADFPAELLAFEEVRDLFIWLDSRDCRVLVTGV